VQYVLLNIVLTNIIKEMGNNCFDLVQ